MSILPDISILNIEILNKKYLPLSPEERIREVYKDFNRILFTSSFGTTSIYLLHLFHQIQPEGNIYFLNTTYHFPETISYKDFLTKEWNLKVIDVVPDKKKNIWTRKHHTWLNDPDRCCSINKVEPLDQLKENFDVWMTGLMSYQSQHRAQANIFEYKKDTIKFNPIIDQNEATVKQYIIDNQLPKHPLYDKGFHSVGCQQCTVAGNGRTGRWGNLSKEECGLHI
ncbi:MAG: phosphoadenylyl-sulfate reductase [Chitinophagales bacterium]|nr:phosphoadenylyl-sulfate reductase [Chitinophagales bacterium]MCZ2394768.1 phosphoadenylyl-sulfate reductase [Chitinophagales bacterium]